VAAPSSRFPDERACYRDPGRAFPFGWGFHFDFRRLALLRTQPQRACQRRTRPHHHNRDFPCVKPLPARQAKSGKRYAARHSVVSALCLEGNAPEHRCNANMAIRLTPTRCLDIRALFRMWLKSARLDLDAQPRASPRRSQKWAEREGHSLLSHRDGLAPTAGGAPRRKDG
jgi:hypothetical protein